VNGAGQAAPSSAPAIAPRDDRGANKKNRGRGNDVPAPQPEREPIADVAPAPRVDRRPEAPAVAQPEERMSRGRGKKADRMEIAPAPQPAPEPPQEVRQPRIDRMPRPAPPQQMAPPPDAPAPAAKGPKPDRGNKKKNGDAEPGEEEE